MTPRFWTVILALSALLAVAAHAEDRATAAPIDASAAPTAADDGGRFFDGSVSGARIPPSAPQDRMRAADFAHHASAPAIPRVAIMDLSATAPPAPPAPPAQAAASVAPFDGGVLGFLGATAKELGSIVSTLRSTLRAKPVPEPKISGMDLGPLTYEATAGSQVGDKTTVANKIVLLRYGVPSTGEYSPKVFAVDQSLLARLQFWKSDYTANPDDIEQGNLGDCYLLASLAEIARQEPRVLFQMIVSFGDGPRRTWVKFWKGAPPASIIVGPLDDKFPVYESGIALPDGENLAGLAVFARPSGPQKPLWPLIIEKAYTVAFRDDSYADTNTGGVAAHTMTRLTGLPSRRYEIDSHQPDYRPVSFDDLARWDAERLPIVIGTKNKPEKGCAKAAPEPGSLCTDPLYMGRDACADDSRDPACRAFKNDKNLPRLVDGHYYWLKKLDASSRLVTLGNPWGGGSPDVTWPWERFKQSLDDVDVNGVSDAR